MPSRLVRTLILHESFVILCYVYAVWLELGIMIVGVCLTMVHGFALQMCSVVWGFGIIVFLESNLIFWNVLSVLVHVESFDICWFHLMVLRIYIDIKVLSCMGHVCGFWCWILPFQDCIPSCPKTEQHVSFVYFVLYIVFCSKTWHLMH